MQASFRLTNEDAFAKESAGKRDSQPSIKVDYAMLPVRTEVESGSQELVYA